MDMIDRIKVLCVQNHISVSALEKSCGLGNGYISKLNKSSPNVKKLQLIADYFGVTLDYLLNGDSPPYRILIEAKDINDVEKLLDKNGIDYDIV